MRLPSVSRQEFVQFYETSRDRCLRAAVAGGMRPADAEDAVAEAFARAWASWSTVRRCDSPQAWVLRTAFNAEISRWRKTRRELFTELPVGVVEDPSVSRGDLTVAIRRLPPRQREVVVLRYLLDLDTATTAAVLGIATGTVTAHLHRGLQTLRRALQPTEGTPS